MWIVLPQEDQDRQAEARTRSIRAICKLLSVLLLSTLASGSRRLEHRWLGRAENGIAKPSAFVVHLYESMSYLSCCVAMHARHRCRVLCKEDLQRPRQTG